MRTILRFLADAVVLLHAGYIAFVVIGMAAIVAGLALRRRWARNFWFRSLHLLAIVVVAAQAIAGLVCPLTLLEKELRLLAGQPAFTGAFIGHWVHKLVF